MDAVNLGDTVMRDGLRIEAIVRCLGVAWSIAPSTSNEEIDALVLEYMRHNGQDPACGILRHYHRECRRHTRDFLAELERQSLSPSTLRSDEICRGENVGGGDSSSA